MIRSLLAAYHEAYSGLPRNAWLLSLGRLVNHGGLGLLLTLGFRRLGKS